MSALPHAPDQRSGQQVQALPHNLRAEQAIIGSLLFDAEVVLDRVGDLCGDHFYVTLYGRIFEEIKARVSRGLTAAPELLAETFRDDPAWIEARGMEHVCDLVERLSEAAAARDYAEAVIDLANRRSLIRAADELRAAAMAPTSEVATADLVQQAEGVLYEIAGKGQASSHVVTFAQAVDAAVANVFAAAERGGEVSGLSTGLIDLDRKLGGLHGTDLIILAGRPSQGKTSLATNIAYNVANAGGRAAFGSLEMSAEQLAMRVLSDVSGISGHDLRTGNLDGDQLRRVRDIRDRIRDKHLDINATGGIAMSKLAAWARRLKRGGGLDLLVVDYLQLVTGDGKANVANRVQEVSAVTMGLKALAKELEIPVLALAQLSRAVEQREDKRPQLSDLRESGSIEQDADIVMFVYRDSYYLARSEPKPGTSEHMAWVDAMNASRGVADLIIGKQRHGPIGTVSLAFDENTTRFSNLAREEHYPGHWSDGR